MHIRYQNFDWILYFVIFVLCSLTYSFIYYYLLSVATMHRFIIMFANPTHPHDNLMNIGFLVVLQMVGNVMICLCLELAMHLMHRQTSLIKNSVENIL